MAVGKEIRGKIKSVENTRKITKAMEMVAASKMRRAQERMRLARPYADKIRNITAHLSAANPEYKHPFLVKREGALPVGLILVSTDKGLCGGLNTNIQRLLLARFRKWESEGVRFQASAIGAKGLAFLQRLGADVVAQAAQLGDRPSLERLIGPIKPLLDAYSQGRIGAIYLGYSRFVNTMKQEPVIVPLLPLSSEGIQAGATTDAAGHAWDYIYEPDAPGVIDELLKRYIEALVYQGVAENMASEQAARMVAMKAATDNAGNLIGELKLIYNKTRQAAITKELSEIVSGAAAV